MDGSSFSEILRAARRGDRDALGRLLATHRERLERMARVRLGMGLRRKLRASDLLQSAYLEVVRCIGDFEGEDEETFLAWVGGILDHNLRDKDRYFRTLKRSRDRDRATLSSAGLSLADPRENPARHAGSEEEMRLMTEAMRTLAPDYRSVLRICVLEGRSHREAAEALSRSEGATRVLLSRARAALLLALRPRGANSAPGA